MGTEQRHIGHYELQTALWENERNDLWKAFDTHRRRYVYITTVHLAPSSATQLLNSFLAETQNITSLQHPNIAVVLDIQHTQNLEGSTASIITEFVDGQLLSDYMQSTVHTGTMLTPQEIVQILAPIAAAIDYAHQHAVIHGAIHPGYITFDKHHTDNCTLGEPKLLGFGMNNQLPAEQLPLHDTFYLAPERIQGNMHNARSDIYSLGVILYELCTGALPFQGDTVEELLEQQLHAQPVSPAIVNPRIRPALITVIMRALAKNPVERFSTASALVLAVARATQLSPDGLSQSGSLSGQGRVQSSQVLPRTELQDLQNSPTHLTPWSSVLTNAYPQQHYPPQGIQSNEQPLTASASPVSPVGLTPAHTPLVTTNAGVQGNAQTPVVNQSLPTQPQSLPGTMPVMENIPALSGRPQPRRKRWPYVVITLVLIGLLLGSVLGVYLLNHTTTTATTPSGLVGQVFFVSSGQVNPDTIQGTADRIQIDLHDLQTPASGKSYYLWLLNDDATHINVLPVLLGSTSNGGRFDLSYDGDSQHNNLLANYSRFLITEEDSGTQPNAPSLDTGTWRYYAEFSRAPNPEDTVNHFSLLAHLRHLLSQDPKLKTAGLAGGLNTWLFRNSTKLLEYAGSIRDSNDGNFTHRQLVRILDYLDGSTYISTEKIPTGIAPLLIDPTTAKVPLLQFDAEQNPPGYLKHISAHLREISVAPGITSEQKKLAIQINMAMSNAQAWLEEVHSDAQKLLAMSPEQLQQPEALALKNHLYTRVNTVLVGETDPNTNQVREGVTQAYYNMYRLATFQVAPYHQ